MDSERSRGHKRIERILDDMGVSYLSEEPFKPYKVDILLPEFWAVIEIDGPYHSRRHDIDRDKLLLEEYGLPTLRIKTNRGWLTTPKLKAAILQFIEEVADSAEVRKAKWLQTTPQ